MNPPDHPPAPPRPPAGWLERNWKTVLPIGIGAALIIVIGCCGGTIYSVMMMLRGSEVHDMAYERATTDPRVIERLGSPIEEGMMVQGQISYSNDDGAAVLQIPIKGPTTKAQINVTAERTDGAWIILYLDVEFSEHDRVVITQQQP